MFKVYPNQIPHHLIDAVLQHHEKFKKSPLSIFRAQGTTHFERPMLNEYNNQINSVHNPHLLGFNKSFSSAVYDIITHKNITDCLSDFTGADAHVLYQSMFFDKSTGTKLHQDSWYLDTMPNGKLVGVWMAMEDIEYPAGPFCLYSKADDRKMDPDEFDFDDIENDKKFKVQYPTSERFDFTARKGDILIWDSFTIHGSLLPNHPSMTRKSLTTHFYPQNSGVQAPPTSRFFSIYDHEKPLPTKNPTLTKATTINPLFYQAICTGMYAIEKFQVLKSLVMPERNDKVTNIRRL